MRKANIIYNKVKENIPKDGRYFSPDGGEFSVVSGIAYWDDGDITDLKDGNLALRFINIDKNE